MGEQLQFKRRERSPNGVRRETTIQRPRNFITVDFGDDLWGTKEILQTVANSQKRTLSSLVREILRRYVVHLERTP